MLGGGGRFTIPAQPIAAAGVLLAFLLPRGALSGVLVVPWIAMALALAWAGIAAVTRNAYPHLSRVNVIGAHLLRLPVDRQRDALVGRDVRAIEYPARVVSHRRPPVVSRPRAAR